MPFITRFEHQLGDTIVRYIAPVNDENYIGLTLLPASRAKDAVPAREHLSGNAIEHLPAAWQPQGAWQHDPLVHLRIHGEPASPSKIQSRSLRHSNSSERSRLKDQSVEKTSDRTIIRTTVADPESGLECLHELIHVHAEPGLRISTQVRNTADDPLTLELLTSFSLGGFTPFADDNAPNRMQLHRFRTAWAAEGKPVSETLEQLGLERAWIHAGVSCERFGSIGSISCLPWHPIAALEDTNAGVIWGAQIVHNTSWQMEVYRRGDRAAFSGGLADREFGQWQKTLASGETFRSPEALLATVSGSMEDLHAAFAIMLDSTRPQSPASEQDLPPMFNEFCTSWGKPTHENLIELADRLQGSGVRYLIIDDGWCERPGPGLQQNGDWRIDRKSFSEGLLATSRAIRERGFIPGIWFEFESVCKGSDAWHQTDHLLHRDGAGVRFRLLLPQLKRA